MEVLKGKSTHPIGKAFQNYLEENKIEKLETKEFKNITGLGIIGKIEDYELILGNSKILEEYKIKNDYKKEEEKLTENGNSIVYVANKEKILAIIGVKDTVRENAADVINELEKNNIETIMLTGDNKKTAEKIANEIGITKIIPNMLPAEKTNYIKNLKTEKKYVMMCGDGINDSPALATAEIGVSVNSGTDIAMDSSDVILTKNN